MATLGLGTVQWGMQYGVANASGQPNLDEVGAMLGLARAHDINLLDTAYAYGTAEAVLGQQAVASKGFQAVTKTKPVRVSNVTDAEVTIVRDGLRESLMRLQTDAVYGVLVHHADALLAPGGDRLWRVLQEFRGERHARKIGVSVYHPWQVERVLEQFDIELVQLPFNLYDRRFAETGVLAKLRERDVEVHSRSAFLQGLLLLEAAELPPHFHAIREHHAHLQQLFRTAGLTPLQGCIGYCLAEPGIDRVLVGCEKQAQLAEIIEAAKVAISDCMLAEMRRYALADEAILNPGNWPKAA